MPSRRRCRRPCWQPRPPAATCSSRPRPAPARPSPSASPWRPALLGEAERFGAGRAAAGAGRRADPRAGAAGRARADLALRRHRRPRRRLRRRHGHPRASSARWPRARTSSSARPAGCATISSAAISTSRRCKAVVLDEADEMLDLGFREDLEFILEATPAERRTLLFSATIPKAIAGPGQALPARRAAHRHHRRARAARRHRVPRAAHRPQRARARGRQPAALLRGARCDACSARPARRCATCTPTWSSAASPAVALSGELTQSERTHALQALRDGRARVCVATDVAARGLDLPDLGLVIHADLPQRPRGAAPPQRPHRPRRPQGRVAC